MGTVFRDLGQINDAMDAYNKSISFKFDFVNAWSNGAEALEKWNKLKELEDWINKAIENFNKIPADLQYFRAKLLWRNSKSKEAISLLSKIMLKNVDGFLHRLIKNK